MQTAEHDSKSLILKKSDLIANVVHRCENLEEAVVDEAVREILDMMTYSISKNERVEIRGFGSFCLHHRDARRARNPKTGEYVDVDAKAVPHFKPGKALRELVDVAG
ncbi:MAG: integration host factor subunit beta [Moraxella sp.]|uniref:integration host factor subunit beta n=1 Tax=Moraxella sp. TaxID=479 RepID=UPI0026DBB530|nr:integration host factor subunit beta [Moraxella sp.]MDO4449490.1 integration host factor subunit beta [Moraxella sp.]